MRLNNSTDDNVGGVGGQLGGENDIEVEQQNNETATMQARGKRKNDDETIDSLAENKRLRLANKTHQENYSSLQQEQLGQGNRFVWRIKRYSTLRDKQYSEEFDINGFKWRLLLFPLGNTHPQGHSETPKSVQTTFCWRQDVLLMQGPRRPSHIPLLSSEDTRIL